LLIAINKINRN